MSSDGIIQEDVVYHVVSIDNILNKYPLRLKSFRKRSICAKKIKRHKSQSLLIVKENMFYHLFDLTCDVKSNLNN